MEVSKLRLFKDKNPNVPIHITFNIIPLVGCIQMELTTFITKIEYF